MILASLAVFRFFSIFWKNQRKYEKIKKRLYKQHFDLKCGHVTAIMLFLSSKVLPDPQDPIGRT